jgi:uncharacterized protein DUF1902
MTRHRAYVVKAVWDDEARVWVASSDDVPGLATEAPNVEALIDKLRVMIPELLEANGQWPHTNHKRARDVSIELLAQYHERLRLRA